MKAVTEFTSPERAALELDLPLLGSLPSPEPATAAVAASFPHDPDMRREYHHVVGRVLQSPLMRHRSLGLVGDVESSQRAHVSSWLAASIASERTVVLIDADLRGAHLSFDERGRAQEGLVDVLRYGVRSPRVVSPTRTAGLSLLPVGSGTMDLAGTFASGAVPSLFEELRRAGDLIVINGPALGDFQAAAPFLAQTPAWILLHELGGSDSHKTRMLRQTFGKEKCLGVIVLTGRDQGAAARWTESPVETAHADVAPPMPPSGDVALAPFPVEPGMPPSTKAIGSAAAEPPAAEERDVTPTPEEIAAWTAETVGPESVGARSPGPDLPDPAATEPETTEPEASGPAPSGPTGPGPGEPLSGEPSEPVTEPSSTPIRSLPLPPPLPPRDEVEPTSPAPDVASGRETRDAPAEAGSAPKGPRRARPARAGIGSGAGPSPASPRPSRERRRPAPVVWIAGVAALLIGGYFLLQDRIPDLRRTPPTGKSPTPTAGLPAREAPERPNPTGLEPSGTAPLSNPSGDVSASTVTTSNDAATPASDRVANGPGRTSERAESGPAATGHSPAASATPAPEAREPQVDRTAPVGSTGALYYVHVSSLSTHDAAKVESARLRRAGYPTGLKRFDLGTRGVWWRVYVGPYGERADANAAASVVKERKLSDYTQVYRLEREGVEAGTGQENR